MSPRTNVATEEQAWIVLERFCWGDFEARVEGVTSSYDLDPSLFQVCWRKLGEKSGWNYLYSSPRRRRPTHEEIMNKVLFKNESAKNFLDEDKLKFDVIRYKIQAVALKKCFLKIIDIQKNRGACPICQRVWSASDKKHDRDCPVDVALTILKKLKEI